MTISEKENSHVTAVADQNLPPEITKHFKVLGLEPYIYNRLHIGLMTHLCIFYYFLYLLPFGYVPRATFLLTYLYSHVIGLGVTVGCHRLWTHHSFKANLPLQIFLMLCQTATLQHTIFLWCRIHRAHHRYMDTDGDPHNSKRGFWFSHLGWLFVPPHPEVEKSYKIVDMSDVASDPVIRFQSRYYWELALLVGVLLPIGLCHWLFPEMSLFHLFVWHGSMYGFEMNVSLCFNSVAHRWGSRPYDKYIMPVENEILSFFVLGEGFHNYHHTFPWDYRASEFGWKLNWSTIFIDMCAKFGWAWDRKTVSHKTLVDRINRTGDPSHALYSDDNNVNKKSNLNENLKHDDDAVLGWDDINLKKEHVKII